MSRRRRLLDIDSGGAAKTRFRAAGVLAAVLGWCAALVAVLASGSVDPSVLAGFAACVLAPLPLWVGARRMRRFLGFDPPPLPLCALVSVAGVVVVGQADRALLLPAALAAGLGYVLARLDDDRTAIWCAPVAALLALASLAASPGPVAAILVPPTLAASLAAHLLLAARTTRRAVLARSLGRRAAPESPAGADRRLAYALPLAAALLVVALLATPLARTPPWELFEGSGRRPDGTRPPPAENRGGRGFADESGASFRDEIASGAFPIPAYEVIAEIVPRNGPQVLGDIGPLRVRGIGLSQLTATGARMRDTRLPTRRKDEEDGLLDGRVRVRPASPGRSLTLEISHYPIPIEPEGWSLLFSLEPLEVVGLPDVRYDPDRLLVATQAPEDWFTYEVVGAWPGTRETAVDDARAVHPDGRYVQLPPSSASLRRVGDLARSVTSGARTDLERVLRTVDHFQSGFAYSLEQTAQPGIAGLSEFLDRRSGYCTHFALACVAMLRSQGLPARVVTGFMTSEWSDAEQAYQVRPRDTHAWFEVHFEGVGWIAFDATPPDLRRAAIDEADGGTPGAAAWAGSLVDRIGALVSSGGDGVSLADVLSVLRRAPASVTRGAALLLVVLALATLLLRLRAASRERGTEAPRQRREVEDLYARLLAALARRGHHKHAAQTPREFAARTAQAGGVAFRPLVALTEELYAVRFGARPLSADLRDRVRSFVRELR